MGLFDKFKEGLTKTKQGFVDKVTELITGYKKLDDEFYEELEEILIQSDLGVQSAMTLIENIQKTAEQEKADTPEKVKDILKEEIKKMLMDKDYALSFPTKEPAVYIFVGVNGVGKTTTIGKFAAKLKGENKKVLLVAADTFRAAAIDQLEIWGNRVGVEVIKHKEGADPAAVVFDGVQAAKSRNVDAVLIDTAGRLHNKANLMQEIAKVTRVIQKEFVGAPHEVILVLDATTGQNGILQAKQFKEATGVTGIALTKLDGTAKGGVVVSICAELGIPIKLIGIGEKVDDLKEFDPDVYVEALFD